MRLRNKKTGEIINGLISAYGVSGDVAISIMDGDSKSGYTDIARYETLAALNEEWEDYAPAEPLIKDEKVRKAVRAWADANDFVRVFYEYDYSNDVARFIVGETIMMIEIDELLEDSKNYAIAELCGSDDEDKE